MAASGVYKVALVAPAETATAYPYLGHEVTEIVLEQPNGEGAALPALPSPDDRSKINESLTGSDAKNDRKKVREAEFAIDFVDAAKKAEIERLYHDGRDVYINPNFARDTVLSCPLMRSVEDITGKRSWLVTRTGQQYKFDETDQVMRAWDDNDAPFAFRGKWSRYFYNAVGGANTATKPAPDSTSHGWGIVSGTVTLGYSESELTPILDRRGITNGKGVTTVQTETTTGTVAIEATGTAGGTNAVVGSVLMKWSGSATFELRSSAGTIFQSKSIAGNGKWQLVKLGAKNSSGATALRLRVTFNLSAVQRTLSLIAAVMLGEDSVALDAPDIGDWADGLTHNATSVSATSSPPNMFLPEMTLSLFLKYTPGRLGILEVGTTPKLTLQKTNFGATPDSDALVLGLSSATGTSTTTAWSDLALNNGIFEGDWLHIVIRADIANGIECFLNGASLGVSSVAWQGWDMGSFVRLGYVFGNAALSGSGMSHLRIDSRRWSADEITEHYRTYFLDAGRAMVEPVFGVLGRIVELDWDGARMGSGSAQCTGSLVWRELDARSEFAPINRQEGNV